MQVSLKALLADKPIEASAPCRIDAGGTWDIKAMALPLQKINPVTVNIALDLRTTVSLSPFEEGWVKISSEGFRKVEIHPKDSLPLTSTMGPFFAAVSYFGFHGIWIHIRSGSPVRSALGGSSTALVALLKALAKAFHRLERENLTRSEIVHLAYHLEDGVSGGNCGLQDHMAAAYGGVNQYVWQYGNRTTPFKKHPLLDRTGQQDLSKRLLVAYSGRTHVSSSINRNWIKDFLSGKTRSGWIRVNETVRRFAGAVREKDWQRSAALLREEMALRRRLTPEAMTPVTKKLVAQAESNGCGARFAGAGAGGSVWALGEADDINRLKESWGGTLASIKGARILECRVDSVGVR